MKILFISTISILVLFLAYFIFLGIKSQSGSARGIINGKLTPCPDTPNCLCSEYADDQSHFIDAIPVSEINSVNLMNTIEQAIESIGGTVKQKNDDYLAATFTSSLFRYVDDFEIRVDREDQLIHIRSASRVGRSDFGANQKRINDFRKTLKQSN